MMWQRKPKRRARVISILLTLSMILSMLPVNGAFGSPEDAGLAPGTSIVNTEPADGITEGQDEQVTTPEEPDGGASDPDKQEPSEGEDQELPGGGDATEGDSQQGDSSAEEPGDPDGGGETDPSDRSDSGEEVTPGGGETEENPGEEPEAGDSSTEGGDGSSGDTSEVTGDGSEDGEAPGDSSEKPGDKSEETENPEGVVPPEGEVKPEGEPKPEQPLPQTPAVKPEEQEDLTFMSSCDGLTVTVTASPDSGIPDYAYLTVEKINDNSFLSAAYMKGIQRELGLSEGQSFFFAPYILKLVADGQEIDPVSGLLQVQMDFDTDPFENADDPDATQYIAHVTSDGRLELIQPDFLNGHSLTFSVASLSVLGPAAVVENQDEMEFEYTSIADLENLEEDEVGAAIERQGFSLMNMIRGDEWSFDIYYVNQDQNYNHVEKDRDFNLKYQMEFHASENLAAEQVKIKIPAVLLTDRDGKELLPTDIAVPAGEPGKTTPSKNTQFNYYYETGSDGIQYLVFFNYTEITAGTNGAWQVLYKNVEAMQVKDGTEWTLDAEVTVTSGAAGDTVETDSPDPLTGVVDTMATLESLTKRAYSLANVSYTPELYTERQVTSYIEGALPEWCAGTNFVQYKYVVWQIKASGSGNQPFNLSIGEKVTAKTTDGTEVTGKVVGYKNDFLVGDTANPKLAYPDDQDKNSGTITEDCREDTWRKTFYVVTAYPADSFTAGDLAQNEITVTLTPVDGKDEPVVQTAQHEWTYADYDWHYRGNIIGMKKWAWGVVSESTGAKGWVEHVGELNAGWLEVYKGLKDLYNSEDQAAYGVTIPFRTESTSRSFAITHEITGEGVGNRIPGKATRVTTVDDAVYAYPSTGPDRGVMMDGDDYYFTSVHIAQTDVGYDVYEDQNDSAKLEELEPYDSTYSGLVISAIFAGSDKWEEVAKVDWNDTGVMTYDFTEADIARKPYRVKVEHDTTNYSTTCEILVELHVRLDSPVMAEMLRDDPDMTAMQFENISGVAGQILNSGVAGDWYQDTKIEGGNYSEPGLEQFTRDLYSTILSRDNAFSRITPVEQNAKATKSHKASNDVDNSRLNVVYTLTAHDGYEMGSKELASYLSMLGLLSSPGRNEVVFYDLLPYGMQFDPSYEVTAGRLTTLDEKRNENPGSWDSKDIKVRVETKANYRDTERTLVAFHISYSGADAATLLDTEWFEGWGVSFRGYWDWRDVGNSDKSANVCAFMPESNDSRPLIGDEGQVYDDDGTLPSGPNEKDYALFGPNIDGSETTQDKCVLYADDVVLDDSVTASMSDIQKLVRADSDTYGSFTRSAAVKPGEGYTYEITVSDSTRPIKDIVIFDRLENASKDRRDSSGSILAGEIEFDDKSWTGELVSVSTDALESAGITPTVYYNADRDAKLPNSDTDAKTVLASNGWVEKSAWPGGDAPKAIAVDLGSYTLEPGQSVSFRIHMKAPDDMPADGAVWAYNNPSFYRVMADGASGDENDKELVEGNSVQVKLGESKGLEVVKKFVNEDEVPAVMQDYAFTFTLTEADVGGGTQNFANKAYTLWNLGPEGWSKVDDGQLRATDANGQLQLKAGQKAVFEDLASPERVTVTEQETPFWESSMEETEAAGLRTITVSNKFRPVLFFTKKLEQVPDDDEKAVQRAKEDTFTFQLYINGEPAGDVPYWFVDSVRIDGGIPNKTTASDGVTSEDSTDSDGKFTLHAGEIIAFLGLGEVSDEWKVVETDSGENWIARQDTATGKMLVNGSSAYVSNIYKWKSLLLSKAFLHQEVGPISLIRPMAVVDPEYFNPYDVQYTFQVEKVDPNTGLLTPVVGNRYTILYANDVVSGSGTLDSQGQFTAGIAGMKVLIQDLEAEATYVVSEVSAKLNGEEMLYKQYIPVSDGEVTLKMPLFSTQAGVTITNDWQLRPLCVKKTVALDATNTAAAQQAAKQVFQMKVEVDLDTDGDGKPDGSLKPLAEQYYNVYKDGEYEKSDYTSSTGTFIIQDGETAVFPDIAPVGADFRITETQSTLFPQLYPAGAQPLEGKLGTDCSMESPATIINGTKNIVLLGKNYVGASWDEQHILDELHSFMQDRITLQSAGLSDEQILVSRGIMEDEHELYLGIFHRLPVHLSVEVRKTQPDGSLSDWTAWPETDTDVTALVFSNPETRTWKAGEPITIDPWEQILLTSGFGPDVAEYRLSEAKDNQHWVFYIQDPDTGMGRLVEVHQTLPEDDAPVGGTPEDMPTAMLENTLEIHDISGSAIFKAMLPGSDPVEPGAKLTLLVERYDSWDEVWVPANDESYLTGQYAEDSVFQGAVLSPEFTTDRVLSTGMDGKITLTKTDGTFPFVQFLDDDAFIYGDPAGDTGMLRIRELLDESDESWGSYFGACQFADMPIYKAGGGSADTYDTIVNSNRDTIIRVAKECGGAPDQVFTFKLSQVLDGTKEQTPTGSISYYLYTNLWDGVGEFVPGDRIGGPYHLGSDGTFTLRAGQYAEFLLPDKTVWTVSELSQAGYVLREMVTWQGEDRTSRVSDDTTKVNADADAVGAHLEVTASVTDYAPGEKLDKSNFTVKLYYSDGTSRTLEPDEFDLSPDTAPVAPGAFTVTVTEKVSGSRMKATAGLKAEDNSPYWFYIADTAELILKNGSEPPAGKTVTESGKIVNSTSPGWMQHLDSIQTVTVQDRIKPQTMSYWFSGGKQITRMDGLENLDTSTVKSMKYTFKGCSSLTELDLSSWDTSAVTDMSHMFDGDSTLADLTLGNWQTGNVTNMQAMFHSCKQLDTMNLTAWDTGKVQDMSKMFSGSGFSSLDLTGINTSSVTDMTQMFYSCSKLASIGDVSGWQTGNVTSMQGMFVMDSKLSSVGGIGAWDTHSVTDMSQMFQMSVFTELDLSGWQTGAVTTFANMFNGNSHLTSLSLDNWDTHSAETFANMFSACYTLHTPGNLDKWNTANVTDMSSMFQGCNALTSVGDLDGWQTGKVTNMSKMFFNCSKLESVGTNHLNSWDVDQVVDMTSMFSGYYGFQPWWSKG